MITLHYNTHMTLQRTKPVHKIFQWLIKDMKGKVLVVSLWNKNNFKNNTPTQFFEVAIHNNYHASHYSLLPWRPLSLWNTSCFSEFPCTLESAIIGATSTVILISQFRDHILLFSGINNSVIYTLIITITTTKNYWTLVASYKLITHFFIIQMRTLHIVIKHKKDGTHCTRNMYGWYKKCMENSMSSPMERYHLWQLSKHGTITENWS